MLVLLTKIPFFKQDYLSHVDICFMTAPLAIARSILFVDELIDDNECSVGERLYDDTQEILGKNF